MAGTTDRIITISFKQIQKGNLFSKYSGLWYKLRGALFSLIDQWYPAVRVTEARVVFVKRFQRTFYLIASEYIFVRNEVESALAPLPHAFSFRAFCTSCLIRFSSWVFILSTDPPDSGAGRPHHSCSGSMEGRDHCSCFTAFSMAFLNASAL